jgi:1,4-dihydroxy-6-naphthoate synthase
LNFAFSTCPNDTFAFHALVHGLVPGPRVVAHLDDVEALNARAERGEAEVTKISMAAYGRVRERFALLRAGGAAGFGVGPIVVARQPRGVGGRVAIPGERTTAALLLRLLGRFDTVPMRFDQIEDAVLRGDADCGVLIHEGRFTYEARGLTLLADLGSIWETRMRCPLPLAAIAIRRDLAPERAEEVDRALHASVAYAFAHPDASRSYVAAHAQEMDPSVVRKHIQLYVNDYTLALDERAVETLLEFARSKGFSQQPASPLPAFAKHEDPRRRNAKIREEGARRSTKREARRSTKKKARRSTKREARRSTKQEARRSTKREARRSTKKK